MSKNKEEMHTVNSNLNELIHTTINKIVHSDDNDFVSLIIKL